MIRRLLLSSASLISGLLLFATPLASAHILKTDNGVSAIMHVKPDDNPVSGTPTAINFLFSDVHGGFSMNDYDITLKVLEDGTERIHVPVPPAFFGAASEGETKVTFPDAAVYDVIAIGVPKDGSAPAFKLDYIVRVTAGNTAANSSNSSSQSTVLLLSGASLIALVMVASRVISTSERYRPAPVAVAKPKPRRKKA